MEQVGEQIKLGRLRRKLTTEQVSERAGINRTTLWSIEKGSPIRIIKQEIVGGKIR